MNAIPNMGASVGRDLSTNVISLGSLGVTLAAFLRLASNLLAGRILRSLLMTLDK